MCQDEAAKAAQFKKLDSFFRKAPIAEKPVVASSVAVVPAVSARTDMDTFVKHLGVGMPTDDIEGVPSDYVSHWKTCKLGRPAGLLKERMFKHWDDSFR